MKIEPTLVNILTELKDTGKLDVLYKSGILSERPYQCVDAYFKVDALTRTMPKTKAVVHTAKLMRVSKRTIYKYLSIMK